ncbi:LysR family transcriptional regulator [Klebsiella pneumoniae subsp. pneumoniae]|nr:LysR family transcriptional regulator [Klebsiella pneumoniae subsp. pneumoniae]
MNLFENIKIFIEIVDAGSFAQAAENLQIHRPAVTKALQQLEQESGVRLLQRTTRRLYLTPEGEEFYRRSKPLLSQADDLLESFAPDRPIRGQLRAGYADRLCPAAGDPASAGFLSGPSGRWRLSSAAPTYAGICCAMVWIACCGWGS